MCRFQPRIKENAISLITHTKRHGNFIQCFVGTFIEMCVCFIFGELLLCKILLKNNIKVEHQQKPERKIK